MEKVKKKIIYCIIAIVIIITGTVYAIGKQADFLNGVYRVIRVNNETFLLRDISQQEKQKIAKDKQLRYQLRETPELIRNILDKDYIKRYDISTAQLTKYSYQKVKVLYAGGNMYLIKFNAGDRIIVVPEKGFSNPALIPSGDFSLYAFQSKNDDIYVYNPKDDSIKKVTKDTVKGYNKENLRKIIRDDGETLMWAWFPLLNNDGSKLVYVTNRRGFAENQNNRDIWIVDMETQEEEFLVEGAKPIAWKDNHLIYCTYNEEIRQINTETGDISTVIPKAGLFIKQGDYIIFRESPQNKSYYFYNIQTGETYEVKTKNDKSRIAFFFIISPDGKKAVAEYFQDATDAESLKLMIITLATNEQQIIEIPHGYKYERLQGWITDTKFAVTLSRNDGNVEETVIINANTGRVEQ